MHRFVDVPPNAFMDQSASIRTADSDHRENLVRGRAATAEAVSAYEQLRRQQLDVIATTRATFFRLANAHAQIEINQKSIISMRQIADISRTKFEVRNALGRPRLSRRQKRANCSNRNAIWNAGFPNKRRN